MITLIRKYEQRGRYDSPTGFELLRNAKGAHFIKRYHLAGDNMSYTANQKG